MYIRFLRCRQTATAGEKPKMINYDKNSLV